jgi:NAD(P)-dependent dehydrogenase (short-subunit alcohol dehydrogenase family)
VLGTGIKRGPMNLRNRLKTALRALIMGEVPVPVQLQTHAPRSNRDPLPSGVMHKGLLSGKNVLITGAGRNIGRSIAHEMAGQGANIFFTDIDAQRLKKLETELTGYKISWKGFVSDVSETKDIDALCAVLKNEEIEIDILVNNAGIQHKDATEIKKLQLEEWYKTFRTNVFGPVYLTKLISQAMICRNTAGSVIFITSIHDSIIRLIPSYSASKASLAMIVKELAFELAPHGIRINGIAPGWVAEDEQGNTYVNESVPLCRSSINPHYIGRTAVYLASDYFSQFTTGSIIKIDAGSSLQNFVSLPKVSFQRNRRGTHLSVI